MEERLQTLYEILNVRQSATLKEIKIAYRKKAMEYHPDTNPSANNEIGHKMMCKINEAYSILRNPDLRRIYDETLLEKNKPVENSTSPTSSQEAPRNEQAKTYKKTCSSNFEQYNYYNSIDFDEYTQNKFIEWIIAFSYKYLTLAFDYYKSMNIDDNSILEKINDSFNDIINYEQELRKKENHIVYNI